jgi:hypothetical protein
MANNAIFTEYDDNGFARAASRVTPVTLGGLQTVKQGAGRLLKVIVTTVTAAAIVTIYDSLATAAGTPLLVIPIAAAAGTVYDLMLPAALGITVQSTGATGNITIGYS